jgi:hypothetical protein
MQFVRHMTTHGEFEPYLNAPLAIRRAEHAAEVLAQGDLGRARGQL